MSLASCQAQVQHSRSSVGALCAVPDHPAPCPSSTAQFLQHFGVCTKLEDLCIRSAGRQYVERSGRVLASEDRGQWFTGWDCLYR